MVVEVFTHVLDNLVTSDDDGSGTLVDDEVEEALTEAELRVRESGWALWELLQARAEEDDLCGEERELASLCPTWEADNADDVSSVDVAVDLGEISFGLPVVRDTDDLDSLEHALEGVEDEVLPTLALEHDSASDAVDFFLEMRVFLAHSGVVAVLLHEVVQSHRDLERVGPGVKYLLLAELEHLGCPCLLVAEWVYLALICTRGLGSLLLGLEAHLLQTLERVLGEGRAVLVGLWWLWLWWLWWWH